MRFLITSVSGKKGYKSFKNLNEYVEFMTKKGHLVKNLKEADLPYTDKPVKLPKVSKSNGWSEVTDFGEVGEEAEKGESLIASTSKSVMKDEASFEMSKSSGKADKPEMGLGAEKGDVDMSDFKSFEYEEPKLKSSEAKESTPKSEEPKSEEKSESKKEEKKDDSKKHNKDIEECLKAAGVQLNEFFKMDAPEEEFKPLKRDVNPERPYIKWDDKAFRDACERIGLNNFLKECRRFFHQTGGSNTKANFLSLINGNKNIDEIIEIIKDNCDKNTFKKLQNYIRDKLILRYLNEGERWDKFKDSVHNLGVKAKQGLGLGMNDEVLESYGVGYLADVFLAATKHITPDDAGFQDTTNRIIKTDSKMKNLHSKVMKFLQNKIYDERFTPSMMESITRRFLTQLGIDEDIINQAYEDYKEEINNGNYEKNSYNNEIAETLRIAGVQLNENEEKYSHDENQAFFEVQDIWEQSGGSYWNYNLKAVCNDIAKDYNVDAEKLFKRVMDYYNKLLNRKDPSRELDHMEVSDYLDKVNKESEERLRKREEYAKSKKDGK